MSCSSQCSIRFRATTCWCVGVCLWRGHVLCLSVSLSLSLPLSLSRSLSLCVCVSLSPPLSLPLSLSVSQSVRSLSGKHMRGPAHIQKDTHVAFTTKFTPICFLVYVVHSPALRQVLQQPRDVAAISGCPKATVSAEDPRPRSRRRRRHVEAVSLADLCFSGRIMRGGILLLR
jgi:hypothetical protein